MFSKITDEYFLAYFLSFWLMVFAIFAVFKGNIQAALVSLAFASGLFILRPHQDTIVASAMVFVVAGTVLMII
jgi:hypothetical protein